MEKDSESGWTTRTLLLSISKLHLTSLLSVFFNGYTRDACGTKRRGNRVPFACIRCDVRGGGSWRPRSKKQRCARFLRKQRAPLVPTFQRPCDVEYSAPASRFSVSACGGFRAPINHAHATASQGLPSQARYHPPTRVAFTTTQNFCDARASYTARTEASIEAKNSLGTKRNAVHSSCNTTRVFRVPLLRWTQTPSLSSCCFPPVDARSFLFLRLTCCMPWSAAKRHRKTM